MFIRDGGEICHLDFLEQKYEIEEGRKMAHMLEIKGGDLLSPMNIFDAMDAIEEYMGADIRQYLEEYLLEEKMEEEVRIDEHFQDVLENLQFKIREIEIAVSGKRTDRKAIFATVEAMKKMIKRELR